MLLIISCLQDRLSFCHCFKKKLPDNEHFIETAYQFSLPDQLTSK